jgi:hypothetical protein
VILVAKLYDHGGQLCKKNMRLIRTELKSRTALRASPFSPFRSFVDQKSLRPLPLTVWVGSNRTALRIFYVDTQRNLYSNFR